MKSLNFNIKNVNILVYVKKNLSFY